MWALAVELALICQKARQIQPPKIQKEWSLHLLSASWFSRNSFLFFLESWQKRTYNSRPSLEKFVDNCHDVCRTDTIFLAPSLLNSQKCFSQLQKSPHDIPWVILPSISDARRASESICSCPLSFLPTLSLCLSLAYEFLRGGPRGVPRDEIRTSGDDEPTAGSGQLAVTRNSIKNTWGGVSISFTGACVTREKERRRIESRAPFNSSWRCKIWRAVWWGGGGSIPEMCSNNFKGYRKNLN